MMILDTYALIPISMIMIGCCSNVITLELIIKQDTRQSNLITFSQFLFVAFMSFLTNIQWKQTYGGIYIPQGLKSRKIPLSMYGIMVSIFFIVSILNNMALSYNISLPFHMVFRSSSLLSTVIIGALFFKKVFTMKQIVSLLMVTIGITIATLNSVPQKKKVETLVLETQESYLTFLIGITMLTLAMFLSSVLGLIQEYTYKQYGKDCHRETIFYSHLFSLPFFLYFYQDLKDNIITNNNSEPFDIGFGISIPILWVYLIINVITQYVCIQGVFILTGKTSTLTCTLVISLRKFLSIIISVLYFSNEFNSTLWICTMLVLIGTFLYSDPFKSNKEKIK